MDHARETIDRLMTLAGMIMEDTVETALLGDHALADQRIALVADAARDVLALTTVALVILRHSRGRS